MPEDQTTRPNNEPNLPEIDAQGLNREVIDAEGNVLGILSVRKGYQFATGSTKVVYGDVFTFQPKDLNEEIILGTVGTPVTAKPLMLPDDEYIQEQIFIAFDTDADWSKAFAQLEVSHGDIEPFLRATEVSPTDREYSVPGIAFANSLEGVLRILKDDGGNLSEAQKRFILASTIEKSVRALENFHSLGLIHGDVGEFDHLENIQLPSRGGHVIIIDYGLTRKTDDTRLQRDEMETFTKALMERIRERGLKDLLPIELLPYIDGATQDPLSSAKLSTPLAETIVALRDTRQHDYPVYVDNIDPDTSFFFASLYHRIAHRLPSGYSPFDRSKIDALVGAIDGVYRDHSAITQVMEAIKETE